MSNVPPSGEGLDPGPPSQGDAPSLSVSVRRGVLWSTLSTVLLRLANVAVTAVVARILSPHEFGVFAVALTAYAIVWGFGELGLSACLIRADLDIDRLAPTVATIAILSSAVLAAAMTAFARPIATALGSAAAVGPIRVMALAVFILGVFTVPNSQMIRDFKQDKIFLANVIGFIASTVLLIILAKLGSGAMAFAWSMVARHLAVGCVLIALAPRYYGFGLARSAISVILKFGLPLAGANFVNYILLNVDYAFVGHLLGAVALGVYMLAFTVASWPTGVLGAVINSVSMPAFSRVKHDPALLKKAMGTAVRAVSLIVMPMCAMMMVLAHPLVLTLYGAKWAAAANVLVVLSLYGAVFMVCLLFANMLTGLGRTKFLLALQLIWIGTLVPAMALGVHRDGVVGAAYAHVAVIVPIVLPSYLLALKRVTGVRITALWKAALPAILASAAAALAARGAAMQFNKPLFQLIAGVAAGGLVYLICAGQQAIPLFGRGRTVERVLHVYSTAARFVGLSPDGRAKHSVKYGSGSAAEAHEYVGRWDLASRTSLSYAHNGAGWLTQSVRFEAGRLVEAIPLYERTLTDRRRLLGSDHPITLRSGNYLAAAYREAGRLTEAIPLYEQTLAGWRCLLGPDHPHTLALCAALADTCREAGRLPEALTLYKGTLERCTRVLGDDHNLTGSVRRNLTVTQEMRGSLIHQPNPSNPSVESEPARYQHDAEPGSLQSPGV